MKFTSIHALGLQCSYSIERILSEDGAAVSCSLYDGSVELHEGQLVKQAIGVSDTCDSVHCQTYLPNHIYVLYHISHFGGFQAWDEITHSSLRLCSIPGKHSQPHGRVVKAYYQRVAMRCIDFCAWSRGCLSLNSIFSAVWH